MKVIVIDFHLPLHSDNEDPLVRGLALRSLCSLRLESILEYVEKPLKKGLNDISAYVRKTAILGVLKVCIIPSILIFTLLIS